MHYSELFKAVDFFKQDTYAYDSAYYRALRAVDWKNLHELSETLIKTHVLGFLNAWKCRIPVTSNVASEIKAAFRSIRPYLQTIEGKRLENIDLGQSVTVTGQPQKITDAISYAFGRMVNVGYRFRHVAASKLLHMVLPELIVMWDNFIIEGYHLSPEATTYSRRFLPQMKEEVDEAIESYVKDHGCSRDVAINAIRAYGSGKTLAKLVDEHNYWRFSTGTRASQA